MIESDVARLQAGNSFEDQLKLYLNTRRKVTVVLQGGIVYSGYVAEVSCGRLILSELTGKECFDAMISISAIVTMEIRARSG
jgi:hypothetical protein